ncbi:hypothetical protein VTJ04DRAFT_2817 [Mycothermus thermophilus]|uniref:uncharacterized protein n=1 Tax=Humicola insolens TaxID=85995 RepID=UPI003743CE36
MYKISNEPHAACPTPSGPAHGHGVAVAASASASSSPARPGAVDLHLPPPDTSAPSHNISSSEPSSSSRRASLPVASLWPLQQRNPIPSASLAASTAEGKPVPITDPTGGSHHPSSTLKKLSSKYPSAAHRQGPTPANQSSQTGLYSQPVIVRTYSGPPPSQGSRGARSRHRQSSGSGSLPRRPPPLRSSASAPGGLDGPGRPIQPTVSSVGIGTTSSISVGPDSSETPGGDVHAVNMPPPSYSTGKNTRSSGGTKLPGGLSLSLPWPFHSRQEPDEPKLPPLEAFSFKSFMADLEGPGEHNISADLDRIAEICARSRYSLSNQYEVHVPPHGSGASFHFGTSLPTASTLSSHGGRHRPRARSNSSGPTLQVVPSDDDGFVTTRTTTNQSRRRYPGTRRRSVAYSTLETIMSTSRSSDEVRSTNKSASELATEIRGRAAAAANSEQANRTTSEQTASGSHVPSLIRKKSSSFAAVVLDTAGGSSAGGDTKSKTSSTTSSGNHHHSGKYGHHQPSSSSSRAPNSASSSLQQLLLLSEPPASSSSLQTSGTPGTGDHSSTNPGPAAAAGAARPNPIRLTRSRTHDGIDIHSAPPPALSASVPSSSVSSSWTGWIPWRMVGTAVAGESSKVGGAGGSGGGGREGRGRGSCAEGSLRQLLRDR